MSKRCPICGAILPPGMTCQMIFDECLIREFTDPAYGQVHMLTVACFMIQHRRYTNEALAWIKPQIQDHLNGVTAQHIRQRAYQETQQRQRTWHVVQREGTVSPPSVVWSVTIADVVPCWDNAETYGEQIKRWARATLAELDSYSH
jgi:hypothetical protein